MDSSGFVWDLGLWDLYAEDQREWVLDDVDKAWSSSVLLSNMKLKCKTLNFHLKSNALGLISKSKIESNGLDLLDCQIISKPC